MYPSLDVSTPAASLAATAGSAGTATAGGSYGDAGSASGGDGPLFPLLRVQVNSKLRVAPQVMVPAADSNSPEDAAAAAAVPRSNFVFDFDVERKAVERAAAVAAKDADAAPPTSTSSPSSWTPPDPWSPLFDRHKDASRQEVALAAALVKAGGREESESAFGIEKTLEPLRQLTSMGFDPKQALGALALSNGDLAAATDACLAAAAASGARI